jgi:histidyl-tRNA synthetase
MSKLQPVRGTYDILPTAYGGDFDKFIAVTTTARELAKLYGFREMATPIFEQTEVFSRSMGESSDVVSKEMFTFATRSGESVTLRPEFTAGVARAFISNGMQQYLPLKLFTTGQVFRYERPQKGRQRQFHQVNFEWLGDDSWQADVEMILLAGHLLSMLSDAQITLHINTLGDAESRQKYREALLDYLTPLADELSEDSKRRLTQNPLRILDSKDGRDRELLINAPIMTDYLSEAASIRFANILAALQSEEQPFFQDIKIDPALVRGLDYYTDTVFEFVANSGELGAQNTVLAGGRYDGLILAMGGKKTPAIGFAAGVERLGLMIADDFVDEENKKIMVLPAEEIPASEVFAITSMLRFSLYDVFADLQLEILWQGSLAKRIEKSAKNAANYVIILSPEDIKNEVCIVRNLQTRKEKRALFEDFEDEAKIIEIFGA